MKHALVTGADGFIGSHLVEALIKRGVKVRALAQYNSFNHWGWLEDVDQSDDLEIVTGDILDPLCCKKITQHVDTVFHLAALIAIPYSYAAPSRFFDTNINGSLNMCQAALENSVSRFVQTSTSEVYGSARYVPIDEQHPLQAQSPYSASKIGADAMAMSFFNSFALPLTVARPFNTYGPRQSARAVIPTIISQIAGGAKQIRLGDTSPTRDFNYVEDTCNAFIAIAESDNTIGEVVNIGSNTEISIADTLDLIKKIMNSDVEWILDEQRLRPAASEVTRLWCDNTKFRELTKVSRSISLAEGLARTIDWFSMSENLKKYKIGIYNT